MSQQRITNPFGNLNMEDNNDPVIRSINETKADYKQLGKSGLRVSVPILGAMSFGDPAWQPWVIKEDEALPLLKAAYDRGLNTWDTVSPSSSMDASEIGTDRPLPGQRLQQRCKRGDHRQSDQEVRAAQEQAGHPQQMLRLRR